MSTTTTADIAHDPTMEYHEWVTPGVGAKLVIRDWLGRKNGETTRFFRLVCNNTECGGEALFRESEIDRLINETLPILTLAPVGSTPEGQKDA